MTGVDYWADYVARDLGLIRVVVPFVPNIPHGGGGPIRNRVMCQIVKAMGEAGHEVSAKFFHDNIDRSRGTKNCRAIAAEMGLVYDIIRG